MRDIPKPLQVYKHFKGTYYQVLTVAKHSETGEKLVIYKALFGSDEVYARPLEMFLSEVDHDKYPDVKQKWRFALATGQGKPAKSPAAAVNVEPEEDSEPEEPDFLDRFLDADSYEEKLDVFTDMWKTINEDNIDNVATVMDLNLTGDTVEEKYKEILTHLKMRARYESSRLR
ncbi:MAG: DUF1653 domain-containing protein [Lachnospiraceae bacterium]|nr:DUF1653 domain-containing protein [Lachnospiraceae bacterium]